MTQEITIGAPFAEMAARLPKTLATVLLDGQGFLVRLTDAPAAYPRMRAHAKGGPDNYAPLPPLARAAALEAWHENFDGQFFRCVRARLWADSVRLNGSQEELELCRLAWEPSDIRIDVQAEWQTFLDLVANLWPVEPAGIRLQVDGKYLPPIILWQQQLYANLATLDAATKTVFTSGFAPGFVRYERLAEKHEGSDLVRYQIKDDFGGQGWGEIWLRAGGPEWTSVTLSALQMRPVALPTEVQAIMALPVEEHGDAVSLLAARAKADWDVNLQTKVAYLRTIWQHYRESLPPQWLSPQRPDAAEALAHAGAELSKRDKRIVAMWQQGYRAEQIGQLEGVSANHILNEISRLRKLLGEEQVPRRR